MSSSAALSERKRYDLAMSFVKDAMTHVGAVLGQKDKGKNLVLAHHHLTCAMEVLGADVMDQVQVDYPEIIAQMANLSLKCKQDAEKLEAVEDGEPTNVIAFANGMKTPN